MHLFEKTIDSEVKKFLQESSTQAKITQKQAGESCRRKQAAPASSSDIWDI